MLNISEAEINVKLPEEVRGKNIDVVLDMGEYTWTVNGMDIVAPKLVEINLHVIMDTTAIPTKTISTLAGNNPTRQLSLVHNGDFGFKASLTVNVGSQHAGTNGNLYYHDSNNKLVFISNGIVQTDGSVSLDFTHASDYVIIFDTAMENTDTDTEQPPVQQPEETSTASFPVIPVIIAVVIIAAVLVLKKKK